MSVPNQFEGERAIDVRPDPAFSDTAKNVSHPHGNLFRLVPEMAQIQTKDAAVLAE
jgi:hypothetical protein